MVSRGAAALALVALAAAPNTVAAQANDTSLRVPVVAATPLTPTPSPGREFWRRLHEEVRLIGSTDLLEFRYARRYGISPELSRKIEQAARAEGVDPELGFRIVRVESGFDPRARSRGGALGLMQLMPGTARSIDRSLRSAEAVMEPGNNLRVGFRYLRNLLDMFDGDVRLAVLAYNRGEVAVARAVRRGANPENGYSRHVLGTNGSNPYSGPGRIAKTPQR
jgi:soluble lytic murein transglycosylase-like protein